MGNGGALAPDAATKKEGTKRMQEKAGKLKRTSKRNERRGENAYEFSSSKLHQLKSGSIVMLADRKLSLERTNGKEGKHGGEKKRKLHIAKVGGRQK